jgi:hypothetical protein
VEALTAPHPTAASTAGTQTQSANQSAANEESRGGYVEVVEALWAYFYGPDAGGVSPFGAGNPAGLALERARRWSNVAGALSAALPLSSFLYLAADAEKGVQTFLRSREWAHRQADPGVVFPHGPGLTTALAAYLTRWARTQEPWIAELARTELRLVGTPAGTSSRAVARGLHLRPGIGAATSGLDAPEYLTRVVAARAHLPWEIVWAATRPVARPVAVVVLPDGHQVVLRDGSAQQVAWVLDHDASDSHADSAFSITAIRPSEHFVRRLRQLGILEAP